MTNCTFKNYRQPNLLVVLFLILLPPSTGCKKFVEIDAPQNQVVSSTVFGDDQTAIASVTGIYSRMTQIISGCFDSGITVTDGLGADEFYRTSSNTNYDVFYSNNIPTNNSVSQTYYWQYAYGYIYQANACIEGLLSSNTLTADTKNQLLGEVKFVRALCYFYLVNSYGDVPLVTTTAYQANQSLPRTSQALIYTSIIKDLVDAKNLMSSNYVSSDKTRPNKLAATALLARTYLYQKDWVNAELQASEVISSGIYNLETFANSFLANSKETIFQIYPSNSSYNSGEGAAFIPTTVTTSKPTYALSTFLLSAYETGDLRKANWTATKTISGVNYVYPYKFKVRSGTTKTEYEVMLRLAEQYLIRAEAREEQGKVTGANSAESDINIVRSRAGLSSSNANTQIAMRLAIAHERQVELSFEWGHRWFDLKRTGRIDAVLGSEKTNWKSTAALFPIPLTEIQENTNLIQNPGYAN